MKIYTWNILSNSLTLHYFMNRPSALIHSYFRLIKPQFSCFRWRLLLASKKRQEKPAWIFRGLPLRSLRNFRDERWWFALCASPLLLLRLRRLYMRQKWRDTGNRSKDTERRKDSDLAVSIISLTPRRSVTFASSIQIFRTYRSTILLVYVNPGQSTRLIIKRRGDDYLQFLPVVIVDAYPHI